MAIVLGWAGSALAIAVIGHFTHIDALRDAGAVLFLASSAIC